MHAGHSALADLVLGVGAPLVAAVAAIFAVVIVVNAALPAAWGEA